MTCMTNMAVTDQQARFFILLSKAGAWDIRNGSIEIHIDSDGEPVKAHTHQFTSLEKLSTAQFDGIVKVVV